MRSMCKGFDLKNIAQDEIDDIEALIDDAGGSANLYGHSSGASLAMEATLRLGKKVKKLAMYEAPYNVTLKPSKRGDNTSNNFQKNSLQVAGAMR